MRIIAIQDLLDRNMVYYPCFDSAYPDSRAAMHLRVLPILFDHVVIPSSHIIRNDDALPSLAEFVPLFTTGICIGSVRMDQNSLYEFFCSKKAELGEQISNAKEDAFLRHVQHYRTVYHRDTESQSASFKEQFEKELEPHADIKEVEELLAHLPRRGVHSLDRGELDGMIVDVTNPDARSKMERAKAKAYFAAGASGNLSWMYDPCNLLFSLHSSYLPREAVIFLSTIFRRAGFELSDIQCVPSERIAELAHSPACEMFRHVLNSTIRKVNAEYKDLLIDMEAKRRDRKKRFGMGVFLANICIGAMGFVNFPAAVASFIAGNFAVAGGLKLIDMFYRLTEPILAVQDDLAELLHEYKRNHDEGRVAVA